MSPTPRKSEIRKAYLLNKYVIITPGRAKRPRDIKEQTVIKRVTDCPLCPENIKNFARRNKNYIKDKIKREDGKWQVIAINNIFPAVSLNNEKAYGTQEVIIESRSHSKELANLEKQEIEQVLRMYAKRTKAISKNEKIDYILCFKNQGSKAGASIVHAHSQVFASHTLPPDVHEELGMAQSYQVKHKICPYCDIIKKEMKNERKIYEDKYIAAFAPYASEYHYEAWIFPKRHLDNITQFNDNEFGSFSRVYKLILEKLQALDLSFNCFLHQAVSWRDQHFYMKIQPRGSVWAGIELGSGLVINSVPPEQAAKYYRE
ncbi:galactose-1-phosphate uridylyltransferase [Candidatus Falkowbacteria bacterium]|nr:MAG: galactose-1-phosphate uridylyltransferase [Candidatus Falkowbacteria bacterium]